MHERFHLGIDNACCKEGLDPLDRAEQVQLRWRRKPEAQKERQVTLLFIAG